MLNRMRGALYMATVAVLLMAALVLAIPRGAAVAVTPQPIHELTQATIANGASLGAAVNLGGAKLTAVTMPDAWTAASLTVQVAADCISYRNLYDEGGTEVTVIASASRHIVFDNATNWEGVRCIKLRSGSAASLVSQAGARIITLTVRYEK
jgi:hypothetical protein